MSEVSDEHYQSKALRDGGMVRLMDFAVRGIPRRFLPGEQYVDVDWARALYASELAQLDELNIHTRWFPSAIVGAALISLIVWPQTIELWRRLARREVSRDGTGADLPCLLYERIERHLNDERLTRRFDFHMHLFQTALAVAHAWAYHDREQHTLFPYRRSSDHRKSVV